MENNDKLKEELHQYTLDIDEQQEIQARLIDESDYFNRILRMNTEVERRKFAAMAMQGILANPDEVHRAGICSKANKMPVAIAEYAVACADALIAEFNKKRDEAK